MTNRSHYPTIFKLFLCLAFLAFAIGSRNAWADDGEELTEEEKAEQAELEAKKKKQQEEIKAQFPYSFNDVADNLVTVECENDAGDRYVGSGFIAKMNGKTYVFTNQHVIMGAAQIDIKTTTGDRVIPRGVELSLTRDIARLPLAANDPHEGFTISDKPAMDMLVAVFGNSEGGGVATELYGKVTGVGADLVEVSAEFVSGNSGSPTLNQDREVIGIVSYVRFYNLKDDDADDDTKPEKKARRFCYRLTDVKWMPVNWKRYTENYGKPFMETEELVDSILDIVYGWVVDPFGPVSNEHRDYDLKKWAKAHNDMVGKIVRLSDKGRATRHELDNINKQISNDIGDSAEALSEFCERKSRHVEMKLSKRDMTGYLRGRFEDQVYSLEYAAEFIDHFGNKLSDIQYFHFK